MPHSTSLGWSWDILGWATLNCLFWSPSLHVTPQGEPGRQSRIWERGEEKCVRQVRKCKATGWIRVKTVPGVKYICSQIKITTLNESNCYFSFRFFKSQIFHTDKGKARNLSRKDESTILGRKYKDASLLSPSLRWWLIGPVWQVSEAALLVKMPFPKTYLVCYDFVCSSKREDHLVGNALAFETGLTFLLEGRQWVALS